MARGFKQIVVPIFRISDSVGLAWGLRICTSNRFLCGADATDPGGALWEPLEKAKLACVLFYNLCQSHFSTILTNAFLCVHQINTQVKSPDSRSWHLIPQYTLGSIRWHYKKNNGCPHKEEHLWKGLPRSRDHDCLLIIIRWQAVCFGRG